ncbi:DUF4157 domain-containing protein [Fulvivirga sp. M361]|nr:DUF4157 domain-containing protein [Fulvivirga sp. M361]
MGSFQSKSSHSEAAQKQSEPADSGPGKPEFQALKLASRQNTIQRKENDTGASDKPAELNARAFAWATASHVAPDQAEHWPDEAGNVVQRKQNHTKPTEKTEENVRINAGAELVERANRQETTVQKKPLTGIESDLPQSPTPKKENKTGLPDHLKSGIENLSGHSMDDVKVHYNSDKPAQLQARAYAQGTDIHLAKGQEKHLPHEAWHVVQQKQGRVEPTLQMKGKVNINDDVALENEADIMGTKAIASKQGSIDQGSRQKEELSSVKDTSQKKVIQRNGESTKELRGMVAPKVGQQDIELAKGIQSRLEDIYTKTMKIDEMSLMNNINYNSAVCLGGIILPPLRSFGSFEELIDACKFINLGKGSVKRGIYELLGGPLKEMIVINTLSTMEKAGQLDYLQKSDFGGIAESGWKVVIEVHYYRNRPSINNVFHKDTLGNTLFVNLNYLNTEKIVGPEYVVNPMENEEHMAHISKSLPGEFLDDRASVMEGIDEPRIIEYAEVPEYGYVSFVDETINHSSPTTEHRTVKGSDIHTYLRKQDESKYDTYKEGHNKWKKRWTNLWGYESYLPHDERFDAQGWLGVFENIEDGDTRYDRNQIRAIERERTVLSNNDIDNLVHIGDHSSFGEVSIPKVKNNGKMTADDRPLKRRMSMNLDREGGIPEKKESGGKRSFFRTWVRAEKVETDVTKPDWKWDQIKEEDK